MNRLESREKQNPNLKTGLSYSTQGLNNRNELRLSSSWRSATKILHPSTVRQNNEQYETKRLSRLTVILTQLQTKQLSTATNWADRFNESVRTTYRENRALEQAGVHILTEDGKGYTINGRI